MSDERKLTIGIPASMTPSPKPLEVALNYAESLVFPLFKVTFVETKKKQDYETQIEVSPSIYKYLKQAFRGNATVAFIDFSVPLGFFTGDMMECFRLLSDVRFMSTIDRWIQVSREGITKALFNRRDMKPQGSNSPKEVVNDAGEILKTAGLLEEVEAATDLLGIARYVMRSGRKDLDSSIYRLGMSIYWTKLVTNQPLLPLLEDTTKVYLNLTTRTIRSKFKGLIQGIDAREGTSRQDFIRLLMCLIVAVYLCNKALLEVRKH